MTGILLFAGLYHDVDKFVKQQDWKYWNLFNGYYKKRSFMS